MTFFILGLAALAAAAGAPTTNSPRPVAFTTSDGWTIHAYYRPPRRAHAVVILVHGVASSKSEWDIFSRRLEEKGVGTLALDLRGHNDSLRSPTGKRDYKDFDAREEWPRAVADLRAARAWLSRRVHATRIALGGASIGANLASQAARDSPPPLFLMLLSPGPEYRGVALQVQPGLKTLVVASRGDGYAFQTLEPLSKIKGHQTLEAPSGHGAQMFADAPTLDRIVDWISAASTPDPISAR